MGRGDRIRALRKEKGMSQIELAEKAGIAVNSLRLYEAGKREPKIDTVGKLAEALDVTRATILGWDREPDAIDEKVLEINGLEEYNPDKETIPAFLDRKAKETKNDPQRAESRPEVTDDDIKFALFGTTEIDQDVYEDVKALARMYAERAQPKNKEKP